MPTKKTYKKNSNNKKSIKPSIFYEVISIISLALSFFLIIAIFIPNGGGFIGNFLSGLLKSLFGLGSYFIPFIVVGLCIYTLLGKETYLLINRIIIGGVLFLLAITLLHINNFSNRDSYTSFSIFINNFDSFFVTNGGFIGALIGNFTLTIFGGIGAYIVIITSIIVLLILLTGRSLISSIVNASLTFKDIFNNFLHNIKTDELLNEYEEDKNDFSSLIDIEEENYTFENTYQKETKPKKIRLVHEDIELNNKPTQEPLNDIKIMGVDIENNNTTKDKTIKEEVFITTSSKLSLQNNKEDASHKINFDINNVVANVEYQFPSIELLGKPPSISSNTKKSQILENSKKLEDTLKSFGVSAKVIEVSKGPTVTRYELSPGAGVKVSKISGLADDLALSLAANGIRIEAPIPGKSAVGIEVPNAETQAVYFREVLESDTFKHFPSKLAFALGKDIAGNVIVSDISKMPHLLIAGATGSGKSVCINTLIVSLIYKSSPEEVKLIMIDPKVVELSVYNGIPHLMIPVVTDPKKAAGALNWAVKEMLKRYELFATTNVRDLKGYNDIAKNQGEPTLPQIVIIIDELADLMMAAPGEVEDAICRLAQMARAAGLHLIIATQRPSVDVITGVIKANVPSRLAFSVSSGVDSRTILDTVGAEKLLGRGDMLFCPIGMNKPIRIQGAFITDKEVESIVEFLKPLNTKAYDQEVIDNITSSSKVLDINQDTDELFEVAVSFVIEKQKASASLLQRQFRIGYQRASRLIESLQDQGIVGPEDGSKPRKVLMTSTQWESLKQGSYNKENITTDKQGDTNEL